MNSIELKEKSSSLITELQDIKQQLQLESDIVVEKEELKSLLKMHDELSEALSNAMTKMCYLLQDHIDELDIITCIEEQGNTRKEVLSAIKDAYEDTEKTIADAEILKLAYKKFSNGTEGLKRRELESTIEIEDIVFLENIAEFETQIEKLCACGIYKSQCSYHK